MIKNSAIWLILSAMGISSCSDHVYVYISNESTQDSVVQLELFINKEKKLDQAFRYTSVIPDYSEFEFALPQTTDSFTIDVISNTGIVKNNVRIPRNEKYVFLSYSYKVSRDSVIKPRDIIIATYKKMPQLE